MAEPIAHNIAKNVKKLRKSRNLTQAELAKLSGLPRPTWANLESGTANPTVGVLLKVAGTFHVPVEELIGAPSVSVKHVLAALVPKRERAGVSVRKLLPDYLKGIELERIEFSARTEILRSPHRAGVKEYLTCESGVIELSLAGEVFKLSEGDVLVFRGDQKHSYRNAGKGIAVGYSALLIDPGNQNEG